MALFVWSSAVSLLLFDSLLCQQRLRYCEKTRTIIGTIEGHLEAAEVATRLGVNTVDGVNPRNAVRAFHRTIANAAGVASVTTLDGGLHIPIGLVPELKSSAGHQQRTTKFLQDVVLLSRTCLYCLKHCETNPNCTCGQRPTAMTDCDCVPAGHKTVCLRPVLCLGDQDFLTPQRLKWLEEQQLPAGNDIIHLARRVLISTFRTQMVQAAGSWVSVIFL